MGAVFEAIVRFDFGLRVVDKNEDRVVLNFFMLIFENYAWLAEFRREDLVFIDEVLHLSMILQNSI